MQDIHQPPDGTQRLVPWAERQASVRAMLLTSSRARPCGPVDVLSDYDVVLVVTDIHPFFEDRTWVQDLGRVLVAYWDPLHPTPGYDSDEVGNVIQYEDGLKIDFTVWPVELLRRIAADTALPAELDAGYQILMDKDHLTDGMRAPTYTAHIPARPTHDTFRTFVEEFFSDAPYVAKCLWREELLPAKWCLDHDMKHVYLRRLLEWRVELDHDWSVPADAMGKGLRKHLPPDIWAQLECAYAGAGMAENWEALFQTMALFRRVAIEVAEHLGYAYPHDLDRRVTAYVRRVQHLDRGVELR